MVTLGHLMKGTVERIGVKHELHYYFDKALIKFEGMEVQFSQLTEQGVAVWTMKGEFICIAHAQCLVDMHSLETGELREMLDQIRERIDGRIA